VKESRKEFISGSQVLKDQEEDHHCPSKRWTDCIEEDLRRAGVSKFGKTTGK